jgi:YD repeat-containing protein
MPPPTGTNSNWTGSVATSYDGNATTVTDQAGKKRRSVTNALEQLIRVDEPDAAGNLGSVSNPVQPTYYSYDVLDNLTQVVQAGSGTGQCGPAGGNCSQTRSFTYNSLSRLTSATNPESGTIQYQYDPNGNLVQKTDARGVVTTYAYDALNRAVVTTYAYDALNLGVVTTYAYDALNRVVQRSCSTPNGTPGKGLSRKERRL